MKKGFTLICIVMCFKAVMAQKDSLAFDDRGKYIYYKVVITNTDDDVLYGRALGFFNGAYNKTTLKLTTQNIKETSAGGGGYFLVSKAGSLVKRDDGRITYKVNVQIKGNKYRYWFTDFVFTPYVRDRYSNFVPVAGQDVDMEKSSAANPGKDTDHYLDECAKFARQAGGRLQQYMLAPVAIKKDTAKKVIHIDKW